MANGTMNDSNTRNQTMQHEQAKASVKDGQSSAIGGGENRSQSNERGPSAEKSSELGEDRSRTGEQGRAGSELSEQR